MLVTTDTFVLCFEKQKKHFRTDNILNSLAEFRFHITFTTGEVLVSGKGLGGKKNED